MTGGGTGGHIYPLVAVAAELQVLAGQAGINPVRGREGSQRTSTSNGINLEIRYLGSCGPYKELLELNNIRVGKIVESKLRRYFSLANFIDGPKFIFSLFQALFKTFWFMPDVVFSKGGPGALAVVLASRFYRIPVIVHESDTVPGLTNLISGRYAKLVAISFESAAAYFPKKDVVLTGNPIRTYLLSGLDKESKENNKGFLGFDPKSPLILVIGGSQGAAAINEFVLDNLPRLLSFTQILHQTGRNNYDAVLTRLESIGGLTEEIKGRYRPVGYFENDIRTAFIASDLVVSRASAGSIFEIAAFGKPSMLIPLPPEVAANDHQTKNANAYAASGAAIVIEQTRLTPDLFLDQLHKLLEDQRELAKISEAARRFAKPEAASNLAKIILKLGGYGES
jgi:UDP-N-acetylglucosamine--N-acetylmuramyl-(pentapeptide) pyrophosphoryl-undecaprenol N-acetylglucosamine transferase